MLKSVSVFALSAMTLCGHAFGADAAIDFSTTSNPTATGWAYGSKATVTGPLQLLTTTFSGTVFYWTNATNIVNGGPWVAKNGSSSTVAGGAFSQASFAPGDVIASPGISVPIVAVRYTIPTPGVYTINAGFHPAGTSFTPMNANVSVVIAGTVVSTATVAGIAGGAPATYNGTYLLNSGESVDFVVRVGTLQWYQASVALRDCTITKIGNAGVACPGDANFDGVVSFDDVTSVLSNFGTSCTRP